MRQLTALLRERTAAAVHASPEARRRFATGMGIAVVAGLFLAYGGAFGTSTAPLGRRLAYWLVTMLVTTAIALTLTPRLYAAPWGRGQPWLQATVAIVGLSIVLTPVVWLLSVAPFRVSSPGGPYGLLRLFGAVLAISACMTGVNALAERRAAHAAPPPPRPRFFDRLPPGLRGGELWAVQAEDHYLRLHTSRGSHLILLRLSDAIAELEGLEGAQTHRSWWVAKDAVQAVKRADGRAVLTLRGGVEAPVSRTFLKPLRDKGWF